MIGFINMFEDIPGLVCTDDTRCETFMYLPIELEKAYGVDLTYIGITGFRKQNDGFVMQGTKTVTHACRHGSKRYMDIRLECPVDCAVQYEASVQRLRKAKPVSTCYVKDYGYQDHMCYVTVGIYTAYGEIERTFHTFLAESHALQALQNSFAPVMDKLRLQGTKENEKADILADWTMKLLPWLKKKPDMRWAIDPMREIRALMYGSDPEHSGEQKVHVTWEQLKEFTPFTPWLPLKKPFKAAAGYTVRVEPVFPVLLESFYDEKLDFSRVAAACGDTSKAVMARDIANQNLSYLLKHSYKLNNSREIEGFMSGSILDVLFLKDKYKRHMAMLSKVQLKPVPKETLERRLSASI